jgi:acyl-coenzyme A thioesterase 9
LLDTYANSSGQIRLGTLLMDLDALSGVVAYKHTGEGVTTVTAAVDRITIKNPLKEICDLELSGQVTFATGRSSMEVSLQIAKAPFSQAERVKEEDVFMTCAFTMVSLDPTTKKPVNVAPLKLETDAERQLYALGEENYNTKKALKHSAITQKAPNAEESKLLHKIWTDSPTYRDAHNPAQKPENVSYMSKATVYSAQIMQPQFRNRHNFMIFGGYLLKQTFELAFTCAAAFSHTKPSFLNLDPSTFENPVPVGSVLYLSAGVTFTEPDSNGGTRIQVIVTTKVRNVEHKQRKNTGTFFYTFHVDNNVQIMPQTYDEFMRWVDGRRRAQRVSASLRANEAGNTQDTIGTMSAERVTE